jgi:hypothetical protein
VAGLLCVWGEEGLRLQAWPPPMLWSSALGLAYLALAAVALVTDCTGKGRSPLVSSSSSSSPSSS